MRNSLNGGAGYLPRIVSRLGHCRRTSHSLIPLSPLQAARRKRLVSASPAAMSGAVS